MNDLFPVVLDGLVLVCLIVTMGFAVRLSLQLKVFRETRGQIQQLIQTLSVQIDTAHQAIEGLRNNVRESGRDLQEIIRDAEALKDELQVITNSGDRLASRLEKGVDSSRSYGGVETSADDRHGKRKRTKTESKKIFEPVFAIHDRDFEDEDVMDDPRFSGFDDDLEEELGSVAEKELYDALRKKG